MSLDIIRSQSCALGKLNVRFSEQIMSAEEYPSIFLRQIKWRLLFKYEVEGEERVDVPKHVAQTAFFFTYLLYTLILHKQIFAVSNAWISKYVIICLQKTASFVLAFTIYNRVRTSTATAKVIVTTSVTVLPSVHRFQNVDLSSIVATNGRWLRFTNSNGQWVCIKCRRKKKNKNNKDPKVISIILYIFFPFTLTALKLWSSTLWLKMT